LIINPPAYNETHPTNGRLADRLTGTLTDALPAGYLEYLRLKLHKLANSPCPNSC
jgi:hypothetical protein